MELHEELKRRPDVHPDDIDAVVGLAERLRTRAREQGEDATLADEDLAPEHVETAIQIVARHRRAADEARAQATGLRRAMIAGALTCVVAVGAIVVGATAGGRTSVAQARVQVESSEVAADSAILDFAALTPRVAATVGSDTGTLTAMQARVANAGSMADCIDAADVLSTELSLRLSSLPPTSDQARAAARLALQDELADRRSEMRIQVGRYESALVQWQAAASQPGGYIAVAVGMAPAPPG